MHESVIVSGRERERATAISRGESERASAGEIPCESEDECMYVLVIV